MRAAAWPSAEEGGAPRILVAIPCHDEAPWLGGVVAAALPHADEVWVVDDGSRDDTPRIAEAAGARLLRHEVNRGYGAAIASCFALARQRGASVLVTLDGDGQHDPREIPDVVAPLAAGAAELVIGSRFLGRPANVPRYRRFGIDVITALYNLGHRPWITDAQCGFRAYGRRAIEALAPADPGMGASVELLIHARGRGLRAAEVAVSCAYHPGGSSMGPVRHGVGVALKVVEHRIRRRAGLGMG